MNLKNAVVLVCLAGSVVAAAPPQPLVDAEELAASDRAQCAVNLIEIGRRIDAYAGSHDGALPNGLSELFAGEGPSVLRTLVCPAARPAVAKGGFYPSYLYVRTKSDGTLDVADDDVLAFDAEPVHEDGHNALLVKGEVVYLSRTAMRARLAEQRERWGKLGHELELAAPDLVPLDEEGLGIVRERTGGPAGRWGAFFASGHFKIIVALVIAIGLVGVLLVRQRRKQA